MEQNKIITYSLLAHINNHNKGIKDFSDIFLPLVKRTLSKFNNDGFTKGLLIDIKNEIDKIYGLDIPFPLLQKNINSIALEFNSKAEKDFQVFSDGSFILHKFLFSEYEEVIGQQELEIEAVNLAYEKYLQENEINKNGQPSLFDFLQSHKMELSNFFAGTNEFKTDTSDFLVQADFINSIKGVKDLYNILKKIYLGAIITSYLEVDFGKDNKNTLEFVLDTTFLVSLLDLHSLEAKHTCDKIIEICQRLGYQLTVLKDTIDEAQGLLKRTAVNFNGNNLAKQIDVNSIYNACERRSLNKTDIERIGANLESTLSNKGIVIINTTIKYRNIAKFSREYEILKARKSNPDGALHDALALIYVQQRRGKKISSFYDGKCWFVTDMKNDLYQSEKNNGERTLQESIKAEELVNILWLSNPNVKTDDIIDIGLTRLVSTTISNSLPNPRLLKELDENIQKYAKDKIDPSDCVRVANLIANRTLTNLEQLNKLAKSNEDDFVMKIKELSEKAKADEIKKEKTRIELIANIHYDFEKKLSDRDTELKKRYQSDLNEKTKVNETQVKILQNAQLENNIKQLEVLRITKLNCETDSIKITTLVLILILCLLIALYLGLGVYLNCHDWNKLEPITYFIGSPLLLYIVYFISTILFPNMELTFNPKSIRSALLKRITNSKFKKWKFDMEQFKKLENEINELQNK